MIVIMAGLPGTGKSTLARELASQLNGFVISKDVLRAALFEPGLVEYSAEQDDFCQKLMLETVEYLIRKQPDLTIFLDGRTFSRKYQRDRAIEAAMRLGVEWRLIECVCSEESALRRIAQDTKHIARNRTAELYGQIRDYFELIDQPKLVIDTDAPVSGCVARAREYLLAAG